MFYKQFSYNFVRSKRLKIRRVFHVTFYSASAQLEEKKKKFYFAKQIKISRALYLT